MAFIDLLQWMLFNIYIEITGYSASLNKNANVKSVLDQMNHKLLSLVFSVPNNLLCNIFVVKKIKVT